MSVRSKINNIEVEMANIQRKAKKLTYRYRQLEQQRNALREAVNKAAMREYVARTDRNGYGFWNDECEQCGDYCRECVHLDMCLEYYNMSCTPTEVNKW